MIVQSQQSFETLKSEAWLGLDIDDDETQGDFYDNKLVTGWSYSDWGNVFSDDSQTSTRAFWNKVYLFIILTSQLLFIV